MKNGIGVGRPGETLLIIAVSARALAQAAKRAGLVPLAIDAFGDLDTREACLDVYKVPYDAEGFRNADLKELVPRIVLAHDPIGLVYGTGFDHRPDQICLMSQYTHILGTAGTSLASAKNPWLFASLCAKFGLKHPDISRTTISGHEGWLSKRAGGCGGIHIQKANAELRLEPDEYWQRQIDGRAISLLFTRDAMSLNPLGWSEQWTSPTPFCPYRFGGAAGPLDMSPDPELYLAMSGLTAALGIRGLASADFICNGQDLWLLEVNPRPGATLDVFDDNSDPLLLHHLSAIDGIAPKRRATTGAKAAQTVYANRDVSVPATHWPPWVMDRPASDSGIRNGEPVCTVIADGATLAAAKFALSQKVGEISTIIEGFGP